MSDYYVGQIFIETYPPEAAIYCDENNYYLADLPPENNKKRFQITAIPEPTPEEQEAEFNRQFFLTSLGYVRRSVSMKDGSHKDFLSDILPLLQVGVPILTYTRELQQNRVLATEQFIDECKQQLLIDFYGVQ